MEGPQEDCSYQTIPQGDILGKNGLFNIWYLYNACKIVDQVFFFFFFLCVCVCVCVCVGGCVWVWVCVCVCVIITRSVVMMMILSEAVNLTKILTSSFYLVYYILSFCSRKS